MPVVWVPLGRHVESEQEDGPDSEAGDKEAEDARDEVHDCQDRQAADECEVKQSNALPAILTQRMDVRALQAAATHEDEHRNLI